MNHDDVRIRQYFNARSATLDLGTGDPAAIVEHAAQRRRRRRSMGTGVVALAVVAAAIGVQQREDNGSEVASQASAAITADPLQWTSVVPQSGLGQSNSIVTTDAGTQFALSTAPGSAGSEAFGRPSTLYRSSDGAEWATVTLPDDVWPSKLAASGEQIYAVGTAPGSAGGTRKVVLASGDGSGAWNQVDLPLELESLDASYGTDVALTNVTIAAGSGEIVVATMLQAWPDPAARVPAGVELSDTGWGRWTSDGLEWVENIGGPEVPRQGESEAPEKPAATIVAGEEQVVASFTWAELGIDDGLRSLIEGEVHVFVSPADASSFEEVAAPATPGGTYDARLEGTADGYFLFVNNWLGDASRPNASVEVWHSADGRTWDAAPNASFPGYIGSTGVMDGRAAVITDSGSSVLRVAQPDGTWSALDLGAGVDAPAGQLTGALSDIGPLGAAAVLAVFAEKDGVDPTLYVVHSPDGTSTSVVPVADLADDVSWPTAIRVSADAVITVLNVDRPTPDTPPSTRLLVGTPAG